MLVTDPAPVIELEGAAFGYDDRTIVSSLDLTVRRGEVVAVDDACSWRSPRRSRRWRSR